MKRGSTQVEIVLAFVLFIGALLFVMYILVQDRNNDERQQNYDTFKERFYQNISSDVDSYAIKLNDSLRNQLVGINVSNAKTVSEVFGDDGRKLNSSMQNGILYIEMDNGDLILRAILSNDLDNNRVFSSPPSALTGNFSLGAVLSRKMLSQSKAMRIADEYNSSYESLKESFGMTKDFSITLRNETGIIMESSNKIPENIKVYSITDRKEMLMNDGELKFVYIDIKIW